MAPEVYPPARQTDISEVIHGHTVADPYRWLEDADDPETKEWAAAQDERWQAYASGLAARGPLRTRLLDLIPGYVGPPHIVGGRRFWTARERGQDHAVLFCSGPDGDGGSDGAGVRVLVDPNALSDDGTVTLDGWAPSWEGDRVAYQLSTGGDEESRLSVLDVTTGEILDGPVDRVRYSPMAWLPGGEELFYVRRLPPDRVPAGEAQFHRRVYRHRIGGGAGGGVADPVEVDSEVYGDGADRTAYFGARTSPDGEWVAVTTSLGTAPRNDLHLRRLSPEGAGEGGGGGGEWLPLMVGVDAEASPHFDRRGWLWVLTNLDAPLGRLCRVPLPPPGEADPADAALGPDSWEEVVASDPDGAVLEDYVLAGEHLVVLWRRHALSEVTIHDRSSGALVRSVAMPGAGAVDLTGRADEGTDVWVGYTDHTTPYVVYALDVATGALTPEPLPPGIPPAEPATATTQITTTQITTTQIVATSADGTPVRLDVVAPTSASPDHLRPTVLYGYGGFDISLTPTYSSSIRAWVEAGGVWVVAHLRGGSEEGEEWHRDGMREHKHHVFEDFEAAADTLVAEGWTTHDQLGIFGGSNGGLLVGAALTRSPERYAAVVCSAPLLDMVRYERFGLGATWNDEYGTAADPVEFTWLLDMSPYHHVEAGTAYPSVLFTVFDSDTRVDPLHARKLAAALQWASAPNPPGAADRPILFRAEGQVGHGARSVSRTVELAADELAFLADKLGLDAWGSG